MFLDYLKQEDFVGIDIKKYLHMGFTRARRYWNHSSGKKWTKQNGKWDTSKRPQCRKVLS